MISTVTNSPDQLSSASLGRWRVTGLVVVFLWFFIGGIAHFAVTQKEVSIVPPYIPYPLAAVLVSGVCELLGAFGLLWRPSRRISGVGLFLLTIAVTPVHITMLQNYAQYPAIPYWVLVLRLPLQLLLLALIAWSTSPPSSTQSLAERR